jgi:serine/threonine-protein kinase
LRGDLAAIVATCLRSKPAARYSSVEALSEDVQRFLNSRPVLARRQTAAYVVAKFLRRRRVPLGIAATLLLTVTLALAYAWTQQREALREAERSVRMQTLLSSLFKMANPSYTGKPAATVPELLRVGLAKLPDFIHDPGDLRQAQLSLAESMFESGASADARAAFANVIAAATRAGANGDKAEAESFAAEIEFQDGNIAAGRALAADALALSRTAGVTPRVHVIAEIYYAFNEDNNGFLKPENLQLLRDAVAQARSRHLSKHDTTLALHNLASDLYQRGSNQEAKAIFEQLLPLYADDPLGLCDRSEVYGWLAWIDNTSGDRAASLPLFQQAYDGYIRCAGPDSRGALDELPYWADALTRLGRAPEAVNLLERALPTWRRVLGASSDQNEMLYFLVRAYLAVGRYHDAEPLAVENLALLTGKLAPDDRNIGIAHLILGQALLGEGRPREALPHARTAVELLVASAASDYGRSLGAEATLLATQAEVALASGNQNSSRKETVESR